MTKSLSLRYLLIPGMLGLQLVSCDGLREESAAPDFDLAIANIHIIDPVTKRIIANQTILINADTIADIVTGNDGEFNLPDSMIINGTDKYVISGFWNMHTHICWKENLDEELFPILLSYGITGVRDMGGDADILNKFKSRIRQNPQSGPTIFGSGPIIDGENPIHPDVSVAVTSENVNKILDSLSAKNVDFFKVYSLLPESVLEQVSVYAQQKNIPFAGHVSEYTSPTKAVQLGQKSFEHLNRIEDMSSDTSLLNLFIETAIGKKSWLCPTLIIYQRKVDLAEQKDLYNPLYDQIDNSLKSEWEYARKKRGGVGADPDKLEQIKARFKQQKRLVKTFYERKLPMLLGTDFAGMPYVYPGFSFHEEMALMSEIGVDNYDVLRMATYDAAAYFEITDSYGSIEKGKVADLVILNKNPVEEIQNSSDIYQVIRAGKKIKSVIN